MVRPRGAFLISVLAVLPLLTGCSNTSTSGTATSPAASPNAAQKIASTPAATPSPSQAASSSTATPTPAATPATASAGCPSNGSHLPDGTSVAKTPDIDGDGKPDIAFWTSAQTFGVLTASGDRITMPVNLAGGGDRAGWIAPLAHGPVVAVVSDGHTATLHALVHCRFITTTSKGKPYTFTLGAGKYGTGEECLNGADDKRRALVGVLAQRHSNGKWTITQTPVTVSQDGTTATNGNSRQLPGNYATGSDALRVANQATCMPLPLAQLAGQ